MDLHTDLHTYMHQQRQRVDSALSEYLPAKGEKPQRLHEAMHYSVFAGGKRLRPLLMLAACTCVGGDDNNAMPAACAMEMIHTYSLIHDDLPAMDDDDFRRGVATNHKVFGEALAILAGDALLTQAFITLAQPQPQLECATQQRVCAIIAAAAGAAGMVGGQVVDMQAEGTSVDLATVEYIHNHKTGALIRASIECGALLGAADAASYNRLCQFGRAAGLAFQIADDILDIVGDQQQLGKDIGSDAERGKATWPAVAGIKAARRQMEQLHQQALTALEPFGDSATALRQMSAYIITRSS